MTTTLSKKELKILIRETMHEALDAELMRLRALTLPEVSDKEQREIEKILGKRPSRRYVKSYTFTMR